MIEDLDRKIYEEKDRYKNYYNKSAKSLKALEIGTRVWIQNYKNSKWDAAGQIVGKGKFRDYLLKLPSGKIIWRNRKFIRPVDK